MKSRCLKLNRAYSNSVQFVKWRQISLELNSKGLYWGSGKENQSCCLVFPRPRQNVKSGRFQAVVVQRRQRNAQKSLMHVQSCCFSNLNLLVFCRSRCRRRRRCISSLMPCDGVPQLPSMTMNCLALSQNLAGTRPFPDPNLILE